MSYAVLSTGSNVKKKRDEYDFNATPVDVIECLIEHYHDAANLDCNHIHEPCCGDGAISEFLIDRDFNVTSTDLVYRGYGIPSIDYLTLDPCDVPALVGVPVITNPPFVLWDEFVRKALEDFQAPFVAMFAKMQIWNAQKRMKLYRDHPPKAIHPLTFRPDFSGQGRPTMDCCWCVWGDDVPFSNEPLGRV